jgi:hypothetical protein
MGRYAQRNVYINRSILSTETELFIDQLHATGQGEYPGAGKKAGFMKAPVRTRLLTGGGFHFLPSSD